jgi:hypothetical protein
MSKKKKKIAFHPLFTGNNRPVAWYYQLDQVKGEKYSTNSVTIFSRPTSEIDESGENGNEKFTTVTLTRAEIKDILSLLEEDIEKMRKYCPDEKFI